MAKINVENIWEHVVVRPMQEADVGAVMQIKEAEGWNQTEKDWRLQMAHDPELCLVESVDSQVIGTVTGLNYGNRVAWIGMMLVSGNFRGLGVSKLLLRTIIDKLKACESIKLDATPAGMPVYSKLGFVKEFEIYRMTTPDLQKVSNHKEQDPILPALENNIPEIVKYDMEVFGASRDTLLSMLIKNNPKMAWLLKKQNQAVGYALGRPGSRYTQIGPVFAQSANDAKALMANALKDFAGQPVVVDVPEYQQALKDWLLSLGFTVQRPLTRMYLKSNCFPGDIGKQFLIAGPEIG